MTDQTEIKDYGTSVNNIKCVGPCYQAKSEIIHPVTLKVHKEDNFNMCPIQPQMDKTGKLIEVDQCLYIEKRKELLSNDLDVIAPIVKFNDSDFLKTYYGIQSLEQAVNLIDEKDRPNNTIKRIMNCTLNVYGKKNIESETFIDFIHRFSNKYWLREFNQKLKKTNKSAITEISLKLTEDTIKGYVKKYLESWSENLFHFLGIKKYMFSRIKK